MDIALFRTKCRNLFCRHRFGAPLLPDMSYGLFIYFSSDGLTSKYYYSLDDPTWEFVSAVVNEYCDVNGYRKGTIIQRIIGKIADRDEPAVHYVQGPVCPKCGRKSWRSSDKRLGVTQLDELSFVNFNNLSELEKKRLVLSELTK